MVFLVSKLFIFFHPSDHELSDNEISNHRHVYVGFHLPSSKKRNTKTGHNGGGGHKGHAKNKHLKVTKEELRPGESLLVVMVVTEESFRILYRVFFQCWKTVFLSLLVNTKYRI